MMQQGFPSVESAGKPFIILAPGNDVLGNDAGVGENVTSFHPSSIPDASVARKFDCNSPPLSLPWNESAVSGGDQKELSGPFFKIG
jgi:hypothetical protein